MQKFATTDSLAVAENTRPAPCDPARARLLLYLQALALPAAEADQLADQALATAQAAQPAALLPAAMAALQDLLAQRIEPPALPRPPQQRRPMQPEPLNRGLPQFLLDHVLAPPAKTARSLLLGLQRRYRQVG